MRAGSRPVRGMAVRAVRVQVRPRSLVERRGPERIDQRVRLLGRLIEHAGCHEPRDLILPPVGRSPGHLPIPQAECPPRMASVAHRHARYVIAVVVLDAILVDPAHGQVDVAARHRRVGLIAVPDVDGIFVAARLLDEESRLEQAATAARIAGIQRSHLAGERIIFLRQASEPDIRARFRKRCLEAGFDPNIVVEVDQLEALLAFVAAGVGVSLVPSLVRRLPFPGVTIRSMSGGIEGGISMVWNPTQLTATARQFITVMRRKRDALAADKR
jgi:DNA-binding transcriptional LysR family regulator